MKSELLSQAPQAAGRCWDWELEKVGLEAPVSRCPIGDPFFWGKQDSLGAQGWCWNQAAEEQET